VARLNNRAARVFERAADNRAVVVICLRKCRLQSEAAKLKGLELTRALIRQSLETFDALVVRWNALPRDERLKFKAALREFVEKVETYRKEELGTRQADSVVFGDDMARFDRLWDDLVGVRDSGGA